MRFRVLAAFVLAVPFSSTAQQTVTPPNPSPSATDQSQKAAALVAKAFTIGPLGMSNGMSFADEEFVLQNGNDADRQKVFQSIRGKLLVLSGTVVSVKNDAVMLAVSDSAVKSKTPDVQLNLDALPIEPPVSAKVTVEGTFAAFSTPPILIQLYNGALYGLDSKQDLDACAKTSAGACSAYADFLAPMCDKQNIACNQRTACYQDRATALEVFNQSGCSPTTQTSLECQSLAFKLGFASTAPPNPLPGLGIPGSGPSPALTLSACDRDNTGELIENLKKMGYQLGLFYWVSHVAGDPPVVPGTPSWPVVQAGHDNEQNADLYICRASLMRESDHINLGVQVGKLLKGRCNIALNGGGTEYDTFEVAESHDLPTIGRRWANPQYGKPETDFERGGTDQDGKPLYICRVNYSYMGKTILGINTGIVETGQQVGKYRDGSCTFEYGGSEISSNDSTLLVLYNHEPNVPPPPPPQNTPKQAGCNEPGGPHCCAMPAKDYYCGLVASPYRFSGCAAQSQNGPVSCTEMKCTQNSNGELEFTAPSCSPPSPVYK